MKWRVNEIFDRLPLIILGSNSRPTTLPPPQKIKAEPRSDLSFVYLITRIFNNFTRSLLVAYEIIFFLFLLVCALLRHSGNGRG